MTVDEFIRAEASRPFVWGETDCASTVDRWIKVATGVSPLSAYGRKHRSEEEASAWLMERGGLPVAVSRVLRATGFATTKEPKPGDVGLVFIYPQTIAVAILGSAMWFAHSEQGACARPPGHFWKAWKVA